MAETLAGINTEMLTKLGLTEAEFWARIHGSPAPLVKQPRKRKAGSEADAFALEKKRRRQKRALALAKTLVTSTDDEAGDEQELNASILDIITPAETTTTTLVDTDGPTLPPKAALQFLANGLSFGVVPTSIRSAVLGNLPFDLSVGVPLTDEYVALAARELTDSFLETSLIVRAIASCKEHGKYRIAVVQVAVRLTLARAKRGRFARTHTVSDAEACTFVLSTADASIQPEIIVTAFTNLMKNVLGKQLVEISKGASVTHVTFGAALCPSISVRAVSERFKANSDAAATAAAAAATTSAAVPDTGSSSGSSQDAEMMAVKVEK